MDAILMQLIERAWLEALRNKNDAADRCIDFPKDPDAKSAHITARAIFFAMDYLRMQAMAELDEAAGSAGE